MEVPGGLAAAALGQFLVKGVGLVALDHGLADHRKLDAIGQPAEVGNLLVAARLLLTEIIGREAKNDQTFVLEAVMQLFQAVVLIGEAAVAGGVHHQQHLALELAQGQRLAIVEAGEFMLEQIRAGRFGNRHDPQGEQTGQAKHFFKLSNHLLLL